MKTAIFFLVAMVFFACKGKNDLQRFVDYINDPDKKITQQIQIGDVRATVKWQPVEYRSLINQSEQADIPDDDFYYFDIRFDKTAGEKPSKEKMLYLNFDMQNDFVLVIGKDSLMPAICQKIENGISGCYQYMLAFEKMKSKKSDEDFMLIYRDKIFATGILAFVYKNEDIQKIPKLKAKNLNEISN